MLAHYERMIGGCRERGLTPVVTFNHFSAPRWFAARGGWEKKGAADLFARYCDHVARKLAKDIGIATTLNEPNILAIVKWLPFPFPPEFAATESAMLLSAAKAMNSEQFSVAN